MWADAHEPDHDHAPLRIGSCRIDPDALVIHGPRGSTHIEPKVMDVLLELMSRRGDVMLRGELIDQVWGTEFGGDESLTRAISRLRKAFDDVSGDRNIIRTIPRRGYSIAAKRSDVRLVSELRRTAGRLVDRHHWFFAGAAAAMAILLATIWAPWADLKVAAVPETGASAPITVEPFEAASSNASIASAAQAMPGTIRQELIRNGVPAASSDSVSGTPSTFSLTGKIYPREDGTRTNLQYVHIATGRLIWAENVDVSAMHVVNTTDIVANRIAHIITCANDMNATIPTGSLDTQTLFFRFCSNTGTNNWNDLSAFANAIYEQNPDDLNARALNALNLAIQSNKRPYPSEQEHRQQVEDVRQIVSEIFRKDPGNALAGLALTRLDSHARDWHALEKYGARMAADKTLPQFMRSTYGGFLRRVGRNNEAVEFYTSMLAAQPSQTMTRSRLAWLQASLGNFRAAETDLAYIERTSPEWEEYLTRKDQIALFYDDPAVAISKLNLLIPTGPPDRMQTCLRRFLESKIAGGANIEAVAEACASIQVDYRMRIFTQLGDLDRAFAQVAHPDDMFPNAEMVLFYPDMARIRADPRFWDLATKLGLTDYWISSGRWPDFCDTDILPAPCETSARRAQLQIAASGGDD